MAKVDTSELEGIELDWAIAKCEGEDYRPNITYDGIGNAYPATEYSTQWGQGGPIIEREKINLFQIDGTDALWQAGIMRTDPGKTHRMNAQEDGPTPLIAAMRCFVASKLGDEVDVPMIGDGS